jgi:hypothetical protein
MEEKMKLSPPKVLSWGIALVLTVAGALGHLGIIPAAGGAVAFWLVFVAAVLLLLASMFKGL